MPDGRLRADAYITKTGVFEYLDDRGRVRRELRLPEEVFAPESLASFAQVPVTDDHPPALLTAKTSKEYMVGMTGENVLRDNDHVRTSLAVTHGDTIRKMEAGKQEVSCGYSCDVDETPGEHPIFGRYDAVQRNIRGNHVAIVDSARAGKSARVRLDEQLLRTNFVATVDSARAGRTANVRMDGAATQLPPARETRGDRMPDEKQQQDTIRALGAQLTEAKERADSFDSQVKTEQARADVAEGKLITAEARIAELQAQLATNAAANETEAVVKERERADAAEAKVARFDSTIEKRIRERSKLERQAGSVLGNEFRMDDLSDREIRAAAVKRLDSTADVSRGVPDGIIEGRFLSLLDGFNRNARSQARVAEIMSSTTESAPRVDAKELQKQKARDQWKAPLPNDIRAVRTGKDS